ncbi:MAG: hypothetical protein ACYC5K_13800, partial [Saccharofermentanales bacterium]
MADNDLLNSIFDTESVAEEIIFNAKAQRKEKIDKAHAEAERIRETAKSRAAAEHKKSVMRAGAEGEMLLAEIKSDAEAKAAGITEAAQALMPEAVKKVAEGIVK